MRQLIILFLFAFLQSCSNGDKDTFSLCGIGITKPYYFTGLRYNGDIYQIEKKFKEDFIPLSTNNDGIAKIRFKVNCMGELGSLNYEEYDLNYRKAELNDSIEVQVKRITSNLQDWIPGTDDDGNTVNSHGFLSFRIINGEIIEILPK